MRFVVVLVLVLEDKAECDDEDDEPFLQIVLPLSHTQQPLGA